MKAHLIDEFRRLSEEVYITYLHPEPYLIDILQLVKTHPDERALFLELFMEILDRKNRSTEVLPFCMRELQWPEIKEEIGKRAESSPAPNNFYSDILAVYRPDWEDEDLYLYYQRRNIDPMDRKVAIAVLLPFEVRVMDSRDREKWLFDLSSRWETEQESLEWISPEFKRELERAHANDAIPGRPNDSKWNEILIHYLTSHFQRFSNSYLEERLRKFDVTSRPVVGQEPTLLACLCCGYLTIDERGTYDLCPVCYWEDEGEVVDIDKVSGPNHISLSQARINFLKIGACEERLLKFVKPEAKRQFVKR